MTEEQQEILKAAQVKYGASKQLDMVVEEASELIQAICKIKRAGLVIDDIIIFPSSLRPEKETTAFFNLCSEVADVEIMIFQIKQMLCQTGKDAIEISKDRKIIRLEERMNKK